MTIFIKDEAESFSYDADPDSDNDIDDYGEVGPLNLDKYVWQAIEYYYCVMDHSSTLLGYI